MTLRGRFALPVIAVAALWGGCGVSDPVPPGESEHLQATVDMIAGRLESIRGLRYRRPVVGVMLSQEVYARQISGSFGETDQSLTKGVALELYQLGYADSRDYDFAGHYQEMVSTNVAGFYVPGTDTLVVVNYDQVSGEESEFRLTLIVAHELVHALQDQHLAWLDGSVSSAVHTSREQADFYLARRHLVEGDAELCATVYVYKHTFGSATPYDDAYADARETFGLGIDVGRLLNNGWLSRPTMFEYDMISPYVVGPYYVERLRRSGGGWAAVDEMFENRSLTMAEIYTGEPSPVRAFPGDRICALLDTGSYDYNDTDNMGVLRMVSLFHDQLDSAEIVQGLGWRGDHLFFVSRDTSSYGRLVWAFSFTTETWADRFWKILSRHIPGERIAAAGFPSNADSTRDSPGQYHRKTWEGVGLTASLVRHGNEIYWLENVGALHDDIVTLLIATANEPMARRSPRIAALGRYRHPPISAVARDRLIERLWRKHSQRNR